MQSPAIGFCGEPEEFDGVHYCPGLTFADGGPPVLVGDDIALSLCRNHYFPNRPAVGGQEYELSAGFLRRCYWRVPTGPGIHADPDPVMVFSVRHWYEYEDLPAVAREAPLIPGCTVSTECFKDDHALSDCVGSASVSRPPACRLQKGLLCSLLVGAHCWLQEIRCGLQW